MIDEDQNKKEIERANAYRDMMNMWAWKDFMRVLENQREAIINDFVSSLDSEVLYVGILKGKMQQIDSIKLEVGYIVRERV